MNRWTKKTHKTVAATFVKQNLRHCQNIWPCLDTRKYILLVLVKLLRYQEPMLPSVKDTEFMDNVTIQINWGKVGLSRQCLVTTGIRLYYESKLLHSQSHFPVLSPQTLPLACVSFLKTVCSQIYSCFT